MSKRAIWLTHLHLRVCHPLVLFGITTSVLVGTSVWLAWHTLEQDQALVDQRIQERLDSTADQVITAVQDRFLHVEAQLASLTVLLDPNIAETIGIGDSATADEVLTVVLEPGELEAHPRKNLRYYPVLPTPAEADPDVFASAEYNEFRRGDYARAATIYEKLTSSGDKATRTGAMIRLGRVLPKANDPQAALDVHRELADSQLGFAVGLLSGIVARHARCVLLDEPDDIPALQREAHMLWPGLQNAEWPVTRATYLSYENEARRWLDADPLLSGATLAAAASCCAWRERPLIYILSTRHPFIDTLLTGLMQTRQRAVPVSYKASWLEISPLL